MHTRVLTGLRRLIRDSQSGDSIQVTWPVLTNYRPVMRSPITRAIVVSYSDHIFIIELEAMYPNMMIDWWQIISCGSMRVLNRGQMTNKTRAKTASVCPGVQIWYWCNFGDLIPVRVTDLLKPIIKLSVIWGYLLPCLDLVANAKVTGRSIYAPSVVTCKCVMTQLTSQPSSLMSAWWVQGYKRPVLGCLESVHNLRSNVKVIIT